MVNLCGEKKKWDGSLFANRQSRKQKINYSLVGPDKLSFINSKL